MAKVIGGRTPGVVQLDDTEKKIILLLQNDGRRTFVEMAEAIGVTERTVSRKFRRLVEEGVMRIVAFANPFLLGYALPAIIGLNIETPRLRSVLQELAEKPELRYVTMTAGSYDIIVEGYFATAASLLNFVTDGLTLTGIRSTKTATVLQLFKFSYEWGLGVPPDELDRLYREVGLRGDGAQDAQGAGSSGGVRDPVMDGDGHPTVLDPLDRQLVRLLQQDGRRAYADLARHTDVTEETVRRKVQRLVDDRCVRIAAVTQPHAIGFEVPIIVGMQVDRSKFRDIIARLVQVPSLHYLAAVTGPDDLIAACYLRDHDELAEFLVDVLGDIPGIHGVDVSVLLQVRKQSYRS